MAESNFSKELLKDFEIALRERAKFTGEIKFDPISRALYSTDASIYQIEPYGVIFPRTKEDMISAVALAGEYRLPVLARGSGSSLAGQAVGRAVIMDCSRHLNRCLEINLEDGWAEVEPGLILASLNRLASKHGLQFGPDPASAERATLGGCIANNAAGAHSIIFGMTADHVLEADVILSDSSQAHFGPVSIDSARHAAADPGQLEAKIYNAALSIRENFREEIQKTWPQTWRRVSGYNLNYLLPWSADQPPLWREAVSSWHGEADYPPVKQGFLNLTNLLVGSEGTLAIIQKARLRLVPLPERTILAVIGYESTASACDDVPYLLTHKPSAVELIPRRLVELAKSVPAYARQLSFVDQLVNKGQIPEALLVVEFSGENIEFLKCKAQQVNRPAYIAETSEAQKQVWAVRKVGLGILMSTPGSQKPVAFIEDLSVPVDQLGVFVREIEMILGNFGVQAEIYAHASAGCLHIRPIIDLKTQQGVVNLRQIAINAVALTLRLGGSVSAEHGDGMVRSEWLQTAYGAKILTAFKSLKEAADPNNLLNPGKIVDPPAMDIHLRYGPSYAASAWKPVMSFQSRGAEGLIDAVEHCNGAGVCRKADGVMCPSFQASQEEMHSTRGRANLLRAMISDQFQSGQLAEKAVKEALDLCLACKGCKAECPSGVDMAKLKYEFSAAYHQKAGHHRRLRDYFFGYIGTFARIGSPFAKLVNGLFEIQVIKSLVEIVFGITKERKFPQLATQPLSRLWSQSEKTNSKPERNGLERVIFLVDAFGEFFYPQASLRALQLLDLAGIDILILPGYGAGRTLISKGFLDAARLRAEEIVQAVKRMDPQGQIPIIGVEPSEIYTLRDEFIDLFPNNPEVNRLAARAWTVEEYLLRFGKNNVPRIANIFPGRCATGKILLHGHCYQKSQPPADDGLPVGAAASVEILQKAGFQVNLIDAGCCGMAGAFGYEAEHYGFSHKVANLKLLPAIHQAAAATPPVHFAASGVSCQAQIADFGGILARHPVEYLWDALQTKVNR